MLTKKVEYTEGKERYRLEVKYGFQKLGNQEPYFAITADLYYYRKNHRWSMVSCGCQHDLIAEKLPELKPLLKWHLSFEDSGPMHYEANGIFWWERSLLKELVPAYRGDTCAIGEKALENFKSTIVYGTSPEFDRIDEVFLTKRSDHDKAFMKVWLRKRLPEVMESFRKDMKEFGVK
jgi:hypothetical protein